MSKKDILEQIKNSFAKKFEDDYPDIGFKYNSTNIMFEYNLGNTIEFSQIGEQGDSSYDSVMEAIEDELFYLEDSKFMEEISENTEIYMLDTLILLIEFWNEQKSNLEVA